MLRKRLTNNNALRLASLQGSPIGLDDETNDAQQNAANKAAQDSSPTQLQQSSPLQRRKTIMGVLQKQAKNMNIEGHELLKVRLNSMDISKKSTREEDKAKITRFIKRDKAFFHNKSKRER